MALAHVPPSTRVETEEGHGHANRASIEQERRERGDPMEVDPVAAIGVRSSANGPASSLPTVTSDGKVWQIFWLQRAALQYVQHRSDVIVVALDKAADGRKLYAAATPQAAYEVCFGMGDFARKHPNGHHQYELIHHERLMRIYYDAEYLVANNPSADGEFCLQALHSYMARAYTEILNRPRASLDLPEAIAVETSHRAGVKVSYHGKMWPQYGVVADMDAQRAFWAHVLCLVTHDLETTTTTEPSEEAQALRVAKRCSNDRLEETWFCDDAVYTRNRLMRMLGACKWCEPNEAPRYLVPEHGQRDDITFAVWNAARIMNIGQSPVVVLDLPRAWYAEANLVFGSSSVKRLSSVQRHSVVASTPLSASAIMARGDAATVAGGVERAVREARPVAPDIWVPIRRSWAKQQAEEEGDLGHALLREMNCDPDTLRDNVIAMLAEIDAKWTESLVSSASSIELELAYSPDQGSLLPTRLRIKPHTLYCPLKQGAHDTCACIVDLWPDGRRQVLCLSRNHPGGRHERTHDADVRYERALARVLLSLWGVASWLGVLDRRFALVYTGGNKMIVDEYDDEDGETTISIRSEKEVRTMLYGGPVYKVWKEDDDDNTPPVPAAPPMAMEVDPTAAANDEDPIQQGLLRLIRKDRGERSADIASTERIRKRWKIDRNPLKLWSKNASRRYQDIVYRPVHETPGFLNMWRGFNIQPLASDNPAPTILRHLFVQVCSENQGYYEYLLHCLALLVQRPDCKLGVAIVLVGAMGTGKNSFAKVLTTIFGRRHSIEIVDGNHFFGRFNEHNRFKNILVLNEAVFPGDKSAASILKAGTTDAMTLFEAKYATPHLCENYWNFIILSNNDFCAPVTKDNRRFFVLRMSNAMYKNKPYFCALHEAIDAGIEVRELLGYLLKRQLPPDWGAQAAMPHTPASIDMMLLNNDNAELAWLVGIARAGEWRAHCRVYVGNSWIEQEFVLIAWDQPTQVPKPVVLEAFLKEVSRMQNPHMRKAFKANSLTALTQMFKTLLPPALFNERVRGPHGRGMCYGFGPMREIRQYLEHELHIQNYFEPFEGPQIEDESMEVDRHNDTVNSVAEAVRRLAQAPRDEFQSDHDEPPFPFF